ncbi:phosphoribulokinase [Desemzia sp. RIT804]|uniref:uridine kinase family protein n=1 Tax=Desemzia sp. RIT 804 TaxID=2810209 RepID=UPI001950BE3D|nr:phosphoribulokinase [Desemzia sp. RIT 804]MBM6613852.1 phosphoribulokinase [Desemzia sp. RIT 804]
MEELLQQLAHQIDHTNKKVIIRISGHGASGKTTFANKLISLLDSKVNYINTDPYIITEVRKYTTINYEYHHQKYIYKMTACHPSAHNLLALERDIKMIQQGLDFYTIGTHYMESTLMSAKNQITIIEGMSAAFLKPDLFDLSVYLYTDDETELIRRGVRDVSERGATINHLNNSHKQRRIQYELFMHPYHENFDIVIKNTDKDFILEKGEF